MDLSRKKLIRAEGIPAPWPLRLDIQAGDTDTTEDRLPRTADRLNFSHVGVFQREMWEAKVITRMKGLVRESVLWGKVGSKGSSWWAGEWGLVWRYWNLGWSLCNGWSSLNGALGFLYAYKCRKKSEIVKARSWCTYIFTHLLELPIPSPLSADTPSLPREVVIENSN